MEHWEGHWHRPPRLTRHQMTVGWLEMGSTEGQTPNPNHALHALSHTCESCVPCVSSAGSMTCDMTRAAARREGCSHTLDSSSRLAASTPRSGTGSQRDAPEKPRENASGHSHTSMHGLPLLRCTLRYLNSPRPFSSPVSIRAMFSPATPHPNVPPTAMFRPKYRWRPTHEVRKRERERY